MPGGPVPSGSASSLPVASARDNLRASGWLVADLALNIWALTIVKLMGLGFPAVQLVFLRAVAGLVLLAPWIWRERAAFADIDRRRLHLLRVGLSTVTLATSFYAVARLPFALFTAINFTRPVILMVMAALILHERIGPRRWLGAVIGLGGALVAVGPDLTAPSPALWALCVTVLTGTGAIVATRRLRGTPAVVMMALYAGGLAFATLPFALWSWQPVMGADWPVLLAIGVFAQAAQLCFLRAHFLGDAGVLAPVFYLSLILTAITGYVFFGEVPTVQMAFGSVAIVASALWVARSG